jgi:transcription initiation factor TFIID TATA-box-binding protein
MMMARIRIENVVASTSLSDTLDLQSIALTLDGAEYEPEQFPGLIYRLKQPKTAILLFRSGKVVCTGGKSMHEVEESIRLVATQIKKSGEKINMHPKIEVQNIVATSDLGCEINLNSIAVTLGLDRVEYEPEQFPGLVYRLDEPRVVLLLFGSGKMVCTGARRPSDIQLAVQKTRKELMGAGLLDGVRDRDDSSDSTPASKPKKSRPASAPNRPVGTPPPETPSPNPSMSG